MNMIKKTVIKTMQQYRTTRIETETEKHYLISIKKTVDEDDETISIKKTVIKTMQQYRTT
jgi:hypothetical protein